MKLSFLFFLLTIFTTISLSQNRAEVSVPPVLHVQGYYHPDLFDNASNISSTNPASLYKFKYPSIGLSYQFDTGIDKISSYLDIEGYRRSEYLPLSAGIIFPFNELSLGISFNKEYDLAYKIPLTILEYPDGIGRSFEFKTQTEIYDYSALASYPLYILPGKNPLSVGVKLILSNLKYYQNLGSIEESADAYTFGFSAGAEYKYEFFEKSSIELGMFYEGHADYEEKVSINSPDISLIDIDTLGLNRPPQYYLVKSNYFLRDRTPEMLNLRLAFTVNPEIILIQSFSNIYWNNVSSNYKNQLETFTQIIYSPGKIIKYSAGLFVSDRKLKNNYIGVQDYSVIFVSGGLEINTGNFNYGFEISDSHMSSSDIRKQTTLRLMLGYNF